MQRRPPFTLRERGNSPRMSVTMKPTELQPWPLDYSWCSRQGPWTPANDVLLEGRVQAKTALSILLCEYFAGLNAGNETMEDCSAESGHWDGGVFLYLTPATVAEQPAAGPAYDHLWLHSRGQDAMDSLAWVSRTICEALQASKQCLAIDWVEHPHTRDYRVRVAPAETHPPPGSEPDVGR